MNTLTCSCGVSLTHGQGVCVECPSCSKLHNTSRATRHKTGYLRCTCLQVLVYKLGVVRIACPECAEEHQVTGGGESSVVARTAQRARANLRIIRGVVAADSDDSSSEEEAERESEASSESEDGEGSESEDGGFLEVVSPTPARPAKKRKAPAEKRLARFRSACPQSVVQRISRARSQRMYMVAVEEVDELSRQYKVLGSTGNLYTVEISRLPSCTCPDFRKGNICKHILLVFLKVLRVSASSHVIYQRALLSTELQELFSSAPPTLIGILANEAVRKRFAELTGKKFEETEEDKRGKQRPIEGDCPICMEDLTEGPVTFCRSCGNNIHKVCLNQWKTGCRSAGNPVTCVYCRADWVDHGCMKKTGSGATSSEGYVNLGAEQGLPSRRDSSSYSSWMGYHRSGYGGYRRNRNYRRRWY